jgi:MFS family permease
LTTFATNILLSLYLQYVKGFTAGKAGLIFLVLPVTQAIVTPFAGKLSDRIEPRIVSTSGMAFALVGLIMLIFLNFGTSVIFVCAILVILGLGMALFNSPNTNSIMSSVTSKHYNIAASLSNTMRTVGNTLSLSFTMIIFALVIGQVSITAQNATQLITCIKIIFSVFSGLSVIGLFTSMARRKQAG